MGMVFQQSWLKAHSKNRWKLVSSQPALQRTTASVNVLTEAVALGLMLINRGGCPNTTASILSINRGGCWPGCSALNNWGGQPFRPPRSPKGKCCAKEFLVVVNSNPLAPCSSFSIGFLCSI
jgi:hypothetical protein